MIDPSSIDLSTLPWVPLDATCCLPSKPGIYFAVSPNGVIQYIGKAKRVRSRWENHHKYDDLSKVGGVKICYLFLDVDDKELLKLEKTLIKHFKPLLNATHTGQSSGTIKNRLAPLRDVQWQVGDFLARWTTSKPFYQLATVVSINPITQEIKLLVNPDTDPQYWHREAIQQDLEGSQWRKFDKKNLPEIIAIRKLIEPAREKSFSERWKEICSLDKEDQDRIVLQARQEGNRQCNLAIALSKIDEQSGDRVLLNSLITIRWYESLFGVADEVPPAEVLREVRSHARAAMAAERIATENVRQK